MSKPIIIYAESHVDAPARKAFAKLLPLLRAQGYSRLCLEEGSQHTQTEMLSIIDKTIAHIEALITQVMALLNITIPKDVFINLPFQQLSTMLRQISPKGENMAFEIKMLHSHKILSEAAITWINSGGTLHTFDKDDALQTDVRKNSMLEVRREAQKTLELRDHFMGSQIKKQYESGEGVIVQMGMGHLAGVLKNLDQLNMRDNCIAIFPHASHWLDDPVEASLQANRITIPASVLSGLVDNETEVERFIAKFKAIFSAKIAMAPVAPTFTPLATAPKEKAPLTSPSQPVPKKDDSFAFMKDAFKNGF